ncbi:MAG: IS256 family transposase [Acidobacteria bacterium]|nr:MAG: IS256 family transposase [Acidobacteriota bacterium]
MVAHNMDVLTWLRKRLEDSDGDVIKEMVEEFAGQLMSAEADALCNANYGERTPDRVNSRNGYRERTFDTRVGTMELAIPKLRTGSYFPDWLVTPRRRAERALIAVVAEAYVQGVSTRRVEKVIKTLGIEAISASQVSALARSLDEGVEAFRSRPLDEGGYPYIWIDAITQRCREGGRVVNVCALIATGVNADGSREILGLDVVTTEDGAGWPSFIRSLKARGLSGVKLVVSDAHEGLKSAIAAELPGAAWQRCRAHFLRNLLTKVPKASADMVATLVRSIFAQPDRASVYAQFERVVAELAPHFEDAAEMLADAREEILAFGTFPKEHWRQIWSNNPQERLNKEIRRRTDVVGIFPNRGSIIRLVGSVLSEQNDEWLITRRYMSIESLAKTRFVVIDAGEDGREGVRPEIEEAG